MLIPLYSGINFTSNCYVIRDLVSNNNNSIAKRIFCLTKKE